MGKYTLAIMTVIFAVGIGLLSAAIVGAIAQNNISAKGFVPAAFFGGILAGCAGPIILKILLKSLKEP